MSLKLPFSQIEALFLSSFFLEKNEAKKRPSSQIALLSRVFGRTRARFA
jgi:hypothetical protein